MIEVQVGEINNLIQLPSRKFELNDKVRNVMIDEDGDGAYETEKLVIDGQVVGYQYQPENTTLNEGAYYRSTGWVYAVFYEDKGSLYFCHFLEDELTKIVDS